MNQEKVVKELIFLFNGTQGKRINKKSYLDEIQNLERRYSGLLSELARGLDDSDDNLEVIANIIPNYAAGEVNKITSKRKRAIQEIDCNLNMVCFFLPVIGTIKSQKAGALAARIVELWNEKMPDSKIGVSTAESINSGFKKGLCYISTAVCHSLQKTDDCYELALLRNYRDQYLLSTDDGKRLVDEYYDIAPTIVNMINRDNGAQDIYNKIWSDYLNPCVNLIRDNKNEECKKMYSEMVFNLEKKYLS